MFKVLEMFFCVNGAYSPDSHTPDSSISYLPVCMPGNNCLEVLSYNKKRDNTLQLHCMIFQVTLKSIMFIPV